MSRVRHSSHRLAAARVDYILAQTMPSIHESLGMARAMASSGVPYIISFCINRTGRVLDGSTLKDAIEYIDSEVRSIRSINTLFLQIHKYKVTIKGYFLEYF